MFDNPLELEFETQVTDLTCFRQSLNWSSMDMMIGGIPGSAKIEKTRVTHRIAHILHGF